ncbi:MAG: hypothetical protein K0R18_881 [Bacillales bacterium]|jgi:hypothetical protein|nr:hypothetical protein [Bacillales bacterium]
MTSLLIHAKRYILSTKIKIRIKNLKVSDPEKPMLHIPTYIE